jgi:general secretion pathway protein F
MPIYEYKGFDTAHGGTKSGIIDADSPREARARLREQAVMVTDLEVSAVSAHVEEEKGAVRRRPRFGRIFKVEKKIKGESSLPIYTRQLATLLKSGIPLAQALGALVEQVEHKDVEAILRDVREQVVRGKSFGEALALHPKLFDDLFVNMVRAGEASGNLDAVLLRLADYRVRQQRIASRVKTALIYPVIMLLIGSGVVIFLVNVVVPKLIRVAKSRGQDLPWMTRLLDVTSRFLQDNLVFLLIGFFVAWIVWRYVLLARDEVRLWWDSLKLKLPVLGDVYKKQIVSRFAVTMSTLLRSGVTVLESLEIVRTVIANRVMQNVLAEVRTRILEGADIATPIKKSGVFPPVVGYMVAVGEQTGQLEEMLDRIAEAYEEEIESTTTRALAVMEPAMIVLLAFIVGFIVIAVMLPILQTSTTIEGG